MNKTVKTAVQTAACFAITTVALRTLNTLQERSNDREAAKLVIAWARPTSRRVPQTTK